jgi:hypothetical protein
VFATNLALEVIVTSKQQSSRHREGDRRNSANWLGDLQEPLVSGRKSKQRVETYLIRCKLAIGANVEKTAGCIV